MNYVSKLMNFVLSMMDFIALHTEMESMLGDFNTYVTYVTYVTYNIYDERPGSNQNNQHTARGGYTLTELLDARHSEDSNEWISSGLNDDLSPPAPGSELQARGGVERLDLADLRR